VNATLVRTDPVLRTLPRWLPISVLSATALLGFVSFVRHSDGWDLINRPPWMSLAMAATMWIAVAIFLISPGCYSRCSDLTLALPLSSRSVWLSHLTAVLLSGVLILGATCGVVAGGVSLLGRIPGRPMTDMPDLLPIMGNLLVVLICVVVLQQSREPHLAKLPARWLRDVGLLLGSFVLAALLVVIPYYWGLVPLVFAWLVGLQTWRGLPPAMSMAPLAAAPAEGGAAGPLRDIGSAGGEMAGWSDAVGAPRQGIGRAWLLFATLYGTLAKKPIFGLLGVPFLFLFGMLLSGGIFNEEEMRISHIVVTAYVLFALTAPWFARLYLVDHLPIDRRRLFAFLMLPSLAFFLLGYVAGAWRASLRGDSRDLVEYRKEDCCHYLYVPIGANEFAQDGDPADNVSPWGEHHEPWSVPLYRGSRAVLYSPYSTPDGSSIEFVALQLSRATEAVYGTRIPADEIRERYLRIDEEGRVALGQEGLPLRRDYPHLEPRRAAPEFPFLFLPAGLLWMGMIWLYLQFFRPGWSVTARNVVFGVLLVVLLAGHIVPFALVIGKFARFWVLIGFFQIASRHFTAALPGGAVTMWIATLLLFAGAYLVAQRRFMRIETSKISYESGQCWM
jgi:MprA protease rhombosortase-interaction domain-containing protein